MLLRKWENYWYLKVLWYNKNMKIYHVFTKSIAGFEIFCEDKDYKRILEMLVYYKNNPFIKFSEYKKLKFKKKYQSNIENPSLVQILAYCIIPTHIYLVLHEKQEKGISDFRNFRGKNNKMFGYNKKNFPKFKI